MQLFREHTCALPPVPSVMAVNLTDIQVDGVRLGIYPDERVGGQPVIVHLRLIFDVSRLRHNDAIEHTADYAALVRCATEVCSRRHYDLLESLVMEVARAQLLAHRTVLHVDVEIAKVKAPVPARVSARWQLCRCELVSS